MLHSFWSVIRGAFSTVNLLYFHYTLSAIPINAIYLGVTYREVKDKKIFLYLAGFALIVLSIFSVFVAKEIHRYPTYKDVVIGFFTIEIIFVDDGSTDKSFQILNEFAEKNSSTRLWLYPENISYI